MTDSFSNCVGYLTWLEMGFLFTACLICMVMGWLGCYYDQKLKHERR